MKATKLILFILSVVIFSGCEKQYGPYEYAQSVNFFSTNLTVSEDENSTEIKVFIYTPEFNAQKKADNISVMVKGYPVKNTLAEAAQYGVDFTTTPEPEIQDTLLIWTFSSEDFQKDTALIVLNPIHDYFSIEDKQFNFFIDDANLQLDMGSHSTLTLNIKNVDTAIQGYSLSAAPTAVSCPNTATGTISTTPAMFTLTSTGLTKDIIVAKTPDFKFSLTDNSADAQDLLVIPLDKLDESGKVNVYVFFAPTAKGTRTGSLYISSYGVRDARVALRGTGL